MLEMAPLYTDILWLGVSVCQLIFQHSTVRHHAVRHHPACNWLHSEFMTTVPVGGYTSLLSNIHGACTSL